jgi:glutamine amidotransferase/cyclase
MNAVQVTLVEYGAGNLPSVERALRRLGAETRCAATPAGFAASQAIVLPGVGHFGALMRTLAERELVVPLRAALADGVPFLGICLGLQALYGSSEEAPDEDGLGLLAGTVRPLPQTVKLPHMGWNQLRHLRPSVLLREVPAAAYFYFAHSYAALDPSSAAVALCDHGAPFVAALEQGKVLAVQFHPEKSGEAGAQVLRNFLEFARRESPQ